MSEKIPVLIKKDYILYFERTPWNDLFIHCDFLGKWNKENKNEFLDDLDNLCSIQEEPIWAMPYIYDKRMQTFLKICKFMKIADVVCGDSKTRAVHIWRK